MFRRLIEAVGYRVIYQSELGIHSHRYSGIDHTMNRPIHQDMSVAPPWAKLRIVKRSKDGSVI